MAGGQNVEWMQQIGERLQRLRSVFNVTQKELCDATAIATSRLNQWEQGVHPPSLEGAQQLRLTYGITLDWLYNGDPRGMAHDLVTRLANAKLPAPAGRRGARPPPKEPQRPLRAQK